jgi:hypothetical protein
MNQIELITKMCPEDRELFTEIRDLLKGHPNGERCAGHVAEMFTEAAQNPAQEAAEAPVEETVAPVEETPIAAEKAAPAVDFDTLHKKMIELIDAGKKPGIRVIVKDYAPNIYDIPADKYGEVWERLLKLEGAA